MEATQLPQPVLTPAIPAHYDVMHRDGVMMVVMSHGDFHAIKSAAMRAMCTLELLAEGQITIEYSTYSIQRDIASLKAIWDINYG